MKGPDDMPAPPREGHSHPCGHGCFCFLERDPDCENCRHKKSSKRLREEYERSRAETWSGV